MNAALKTKEPQDNRPILLMAQDEGRFGLWSQVMKAWCLLDHRPLVAKQGVRDLDCCDLPERSPNAIAHQAGTSLCCLANKREKTSSAD